MHFISIIFLSLLNELSFKITSNVTKIITALLLLTLSCLLAYMPNLFHGLELYRIAGFDKLSINSSFFLFMVVLSIPILFSQDLKIKINKGFGYWVLIIYIFSLTLSSYVFVSTAALSFVWMLYFYFFDANKNIFEKLMMHFQLFLSFVIFKEIFFEHIVLMRSILYLSSTILVVNETKKVIRNKYSISSVWMMFVLMLYGKVVYTQFGLEENVIILSLFISLFLLLNRASDPSGIFTILLYFIWVLGLLSPLVFVLMILGSIFWSKKEKFINGKLKIKKSDFFINILYWLPLFFIPVIIVNNELSINVLISFTILYFIGLLMGFKGSWVTLLFNCKNTKSYTFGLLAYITGFLIFWNDKL